jgi:hypothetical protein
VEATQVADREGVPLFLAPEAAEAPVGQGLLGLEQARLLASPADLEALLDSARSFVPGTRPKPHDPTTPGGDVQLRLFDDPDSLPPPRGSGPPPPRGEGWGGGT